MFLNAVILILQEILEAALLLSMLLAVNRLLALKSEAGNVTAGYWYGGAMLAGLAGAAIYAQAMPVISEWFDYAGQEVINSAMQTLVIACLFLHCLTLPQQVRGLRWAKMVGGINLIVMMAVGITREGSEIFLYLNGISPDPTSLTPALLGSALATGIGVSCGILLYFGVLGLRPHVGLRVGLLLLALFAGNMASQSVVHLTQVDWLPYSPQVWDASALLDEYSVTGQLLYALIGYEATPSLLQMAGYLAAVALIASTPVFRHSWRRQ